jgi:hypothetical protein
MARADEIRMAARASLEAYRADPEYQFILTHREEIPPKVQKKICIGAVLGYVGGLEHAIAAGDLVSMRRHGCPDGYLRSFESCAQHVREFLNDGEDFAAIQDIEEPEDEGFDEDHDEEFCEEPEHDFDGMTMSM